MIIVHVVDFLKSIGLLGQLFLLLAILVGAGWLRHKINGNCPWCGSNKLQFRDGLFLGIEHWRCLSCNNGGDVKGGKYVK